MTSRSEGADGPVIRVALGIRFELFNDADKPIGALVREDVKGAAVPRAGELLGRGTLGTELHTLIGIAPTVHQVDHYIAVPGARDWDPMCMVVSRVSNVQVEDLQSARQVLEAQGWSVMIFDRT